jgi:RNA polymerase sigma-70 factor, ECF subfamily
MDRGWVVRAQEGDETAYALIVEAVIGRLAAVARLILRDSSAAQDAVQETLVEAWRGLPTLRDPERLEPWLRRLLVRACADHARRDRRRRIAEIPVAGVWRATSEIAADGIVLRDEVERALAVLPIEQRTVLVLAYYLDLPVSETALALGIPVGTVKSRLDRARSALRAALESERRVALTVEGRPA